MKDLRIPIYTGIVVALFGSVLMFSLVGLALLGPKAVGSGMEMIGGTILFLFIYLGLLFGIYYVLTRKKKSNGNILVFKDAIITGFIASLSTALMSVLFTYLFYEIVCPNYVDTLLDALRSNMESVPLPKDKIDQKILERAAYYRTGTQSLYSFSGNLLTGITFTLLLSFFLKSQKK